MISVRQFIYWSTQCVLYLPLAAFANRQHDKRDGVLRDRYQQHHRPTHVFHPFKYTPCPHCPAENIYDPYQPVTSIYPPPGSCKAAATTYAVAPFYDFVFSPQKTVTYYEYDATGRPVRPPYVNAISHHVYTHTYGVHGDPYVARRTTHVARPTVLALDVGNGLYETRTIRHAPTNVVYAVQTSDVVKSRTVRKTHTRTVHHNPTPATAPHTEADSGVSLNLHNAPQSKFFVYVRSADQALNGLTVSHLNGRVVAGTAGGGREFYINRAKQLADGDNDIVFFDDPETADTSVKSNLCQLKIGSVPNRDLTISSIIALQGDVMNFTNEDGQERRFYACPASSDNEDDSFSHYIKVAAMSDKSDVTGCTGVKLSQEVSFTGNK